MSLRLFSPEKRLAFENLLTPVRKQSRTWASRSLIVAYQSAQVVPFAACDFGHVTGIRDRLVALVDQHYNPLSDLSVQSADEVVEALRAGLVAQPHSGASANAVQLRSQVDMQVARAPEVPLAEAEAHDGMADGPVPALVGAQSFEECPIALEQLLQSVQEEALAEASRPRQKVMCPLLDKPHGNAGLVDVTAVVLAKRAERLYPYGHPAPDGRGPHGQPNRDFNRKARGALAGDWSWPRDRHTGGTH